MVIIACVFIVYLVLVTWFSISIENTNFNDDKSQICIVLVNIFESLALLLLAYPPAILHDLRITYTNTYK